MTTQFDRFAAEGGDDWAYKLLTDHQFFITELWKDRGWDFYAPLGWIERDIVDYGFTGPSRRGILAPRSTGKTHLITISLSLFRLARNPDRKIIIPSKSGSTAKETLKLIRDLFNDCHFLRHLAPTDGQRDTRVAFDVAGAQPHKQPSVSSYGVDGPLPGNRAHTIIPDDVEDDDNTVTVASRQYLADRVNEFESILYDDLPPEKRDDFYDPVEIVYVGTYHHEESLYLKESKRGFTFRTWDIECPAPGDKHLNLAPLIVQLRDRGSVKPGDNLWSHRFSQEWLDKKRAKGRRYYRLNYRLFSDMADSEMYPLRLSDLMVMDVDPVLAPTYLAWGRTNHNGSTALDIPSLGFGNDLFHRPAIISDDPKPYQGTKAFIDPAGRGADKVGYCSIGMLAGFLHVKSLTGLDGGYSVDNLNRLAALCKRDRVNEIYIESTWGGGMFDQLFEPILRKHFLEPNQDPAYPDGWKASIVDDTKITRPSGIKHVRICDTLEPAVSTHRVVIDTKIAHDHAFQLQFTRIRREPNSIDHEDEIDALSGCIKAWQHDLQVDPEDAAAQLRKVAEEDKEAKFRLLVGGPYRPKQPPAFYSFQK